MPGLRYDCIRTDSFAGTETDVMFRRMPTLPPRLRALAGKLCLVAGVLLIGGIAFFLGRAIGLGHVTAQSVPGGATLAPPGTATASPYSEEYGGRVVAYI